MKKRAIIYFLICFIIINIALPFSIKSYADPFTAGQIASTAYAMMQSWGISFTAGSATASGMNSFMSNQVEDYVNSKGGTIADVFIGQIAVDAAGKLVVAHEMYNSVIEFVDWLKEKYDLSSVDFSLTNGEIGGKFAPYTSEGSEIPSVGWYVYTWNPSRYEGFKNAQLYINGVAYSGAASSAADPMCFTSTSIDVKGNYGGYYITMKRGDTGKVISTTWVQGPAISHLNTLSWNGTDYVEPIVLNPDKEWVGTIGGYSVPDTNLDQLLGNIDQAIADNNLVVDGEVIDIPIPPPSPVPIDPGTPLGDVPWEGLDTNLQNLYNQGLEEIGAIGDAQDAITDAVVDLTGVLEGAIADNAGVVSGAIDQAISDVGTAIGQNASVVSGAIDQAVSDIQTSISEQTDTLDESLSATAEGVETIAEALEDENINWQKFDLRGLFPFCIPFDIYNMLEALDASPTAPHVQLPFVIESIGFSYTIDLDFSAFDTVAAVMRQMELLVYGIALAWATSKVIKW